MEKENYYPDERYCKSVNCNTHTYIEKMILYQNIDILRRNIFIKRIKKERRRFCDICKAKTYKNFLEGKLIQFKSNIYKIIEEQLKSYKHQGFKWRRTGDSIDRCQIWTPNYFIDGENISDLIEHYKKQNQNVVIKNKLKILKF